MKKIIILLSILSLVFCGGGEKNLSSEAESQAQKEEGHEHEELQVSPEKQKSWGIEFGFATQQNIASEITLPGVLSLNKNRTAHISSFVPGQVSSLSADLGNQVRKGQALMTINSPEFAKAQADFLQARARMNLSRKEYERAKSLLKEKAIEEKEYLRREAEYEKISTEYGALGSALHSYGITHDYIEELIKKCESIEDDEYKCEIANPNLPLLSPISGTIIFRDMIIGEQIEPNKILLTVSNLKTLWAILDAYEKDIPFIDSESQVTIVYPLYPEKSFTGTITYISNLIDERLRTIKLRVEVNNDEGLLKPNMYIQGVIQNLTKSQGILAVSEEAVQNFEGEKIVFVVENNDIFAVRHIKIGKKVREKRIITEGLAEGEKIVIKGAFKIKTELTKATFGQTHVH